MNRVFLRKLARPPGEYRGLAFWAWNGRLEEAELRRQIHLMHRMGLGGFFMHARVGLATPYLSPEWFRLVGACADEAKRLGMRAWLYDEDRWPSGFAGGFVTRNPAYRMRRLAVRILGDSERLRWGPALAAAFVARLDGVRADGVRRIPRGGSPKLAPGEQRVAFTLEVYACSPSFNGFSYIDTLNAEAVRAFIRITHAAYRKYNGRYFGGVIPGIFTDEPRYGHLLDVDLKTGQPGGLPWTGVLPALFRRRYGYDLIPHLMELVFDVDGRGMRPARLHYHDCLTQLYVDAFCRQISAWCERNHLIFTGHHQDEDSLSGQTHVVGSCLRAYEYMQAPGIDLLGENRRLYDIVKQASSAARQFGRKWRLTETYGCTGWDFPLAGHKALGDWQAALGINLRCQHLAWYTMEGQAKRDYPASIFYQSPWWELYPKVEDYFARLHVVMTRGREVRDVLVIHPVESMWMMCRRGWRDDACVARYDRMLLALRDSLLTAHLDFDYGDEDILARHARVSRGKGRAVLHVGRAAYTVVVVPPLNTMRRTTLGLLRRFAAAGGVVVFAGEPAGWVDAENSADVLRLAAQCVRAPECGAALAAAVERAGRRVSIADPTGREIAATLYQLREDREACYLFLCNTGHAPGQIKTGFLDVPVRERRTPYPEVQIRGFAECAGAPLECNPETGALTTADAVRQAGAWLIRTGLPALGSRLFIVPKKKSARRFPRPPAWREVGRRLLAPARWPIALSEPNVLALDYPACRIGSGAWQAPRDALIVDRQIRRRLGLPLRGGGMVQPWARKPEPLSRRVSFELSYAFEVAVLPKGQVCLALEQPRRYRVAVNGHELSTDVECGCWVDPSLKTLAFAPALLHLGRNNIRLTGDYAADHPGLEMIYLLGEFGVRVQGVRAVLSARPESLEIGDWCRQGLPFYSGSIIYRCRLAPHLRKGERLFLQVPAYRGAAVRVLVNSRVAGVIAWEPNEVDLTSALAPRGQPNWLQIEVVAHRRNSHGPLHFPFDPSTASGPDTFLVKQTRDYRLVPCGLMGPPSLSVRKACFL